MEWPDRRSGSKSAPARLGSAVVGLAGGLLRTGYHHSAAHDRSRLFGRRIGMFVGFAEAVASQQEDFGVFHETVGDSGRDGRIKEDVAPVRERRVSGDDARTFVAMAGGDHLIKEVGGLL